MNQFLEWLSSFFGSWKFWVVVAPWDIGVRVRLGKNAIPLQPGVHWRIPFVDDIVSVNTRLRQATAPPVTVSGNNGRALSRVLTANIAYRVTDPVLAMMTYTNVTNALLMLLQAEVLDYADPDVICRRMNEMVGSKGIEVMSVRYVENVEVRTLRLLQNQWQLQEDQDPLLENGKRRRW